MKKDFDMYYEFVNKANKKTACYIKVRQYKYGWVFKSSGKLIKEKRLDELMFVKPVVKRKLTNKQIQNYGNQHFSFKTHYK